MRAQYATGPDPPAPAEPPAAISAHLNGPLRDQGPGDQNQPPPTPGDSLDVHSGGSAIRGKGIYAASAYHRCRTFDPKRWDVRPALSRSEEHTSELQSRGHLVCRLLLEKKKTNT